MAKSKHNPSQLKQAVRTLKRENAKLTEQRDDMFKLLRDKLKASRDSQRQLAENCKHYRQRIGGLLSDNNAQNAHTAGQELEIESLKAALRASDRSKIALRLALDRGRKQFYATTAVLGGILVLTALVGAGTYFGG